MSKTICDMELDTMSTEELKTVLKNELSQASKNYERIYGILEVLRIRKPKIKRAVPHAVTQQEIDSALLICQEADTPSQPEPKPLWRRKPTAAVAAILCILLIAIPAASGMPFIQQMIAKWNENFFWIDTPGTPVAPPEGYVFQTDNPGLQKLYDAVTEFGITQPIVPMWLPEGYELVFFEKTRTEKEEKISAHFAKLGNQLSFFAQKKECGTTLERHKVNSNPEEWFLHGTSYYYFDNNSYNDVAWIVGSYEITITTQESKSLLHDIIESIHGRNEE